MGVKLNCDQCNKFIRDIRPQDIGKMRNDEETLCDECIAMIGAWSKRVQTAGDAAIKTISRSVATAKARFDKVLNDRQIQEGRS
jgi:hypothetical protein